MTVLNVTAALTALGGSTPVTSGRVTVEYLRGKDGAPATRVGGAMVTLPVPVVVEIVDGSPVAPVDVPPTDGTCYARVWVECRVPRDAGFLELPAVAIPAAGPVDIAALVAVDPASFEPVTTVVTAWELAVGEVAGLRDVVTEKTAQAVAAASDAGTFAGAADFDANRAGQSAFQASQSAASALGHKNDAKGSADAAAGSVTAAQTARTGAETARAGAEAAQTAAGTARTGAETAQSGAVTARTGAETARTGAETAKAGAETAKAGAEAARDLALAGQFLGSALTSANDLNAITTPGVYRCASGAFATSANNYPAVGVAGVLTVTQWGGAGQVVQRYTPYPSAGSPFVTVGEWVRAYRGSSFSAWRFIASQRINNPAGQPGVEVFTWDDQNAREQQMTPAAVALGTADLNAVTVLGTYTQGQTANATAARNYPVEGGSGTLEVLPNNAGVDLIQRYTVRHTGSRGRGGHYTRVLQGGTWTAWVFLAVQRVDQTAGRAIYAWDDVNGREQMIYGDTGWRSLGSAWLVNGWTCAGMYVRRCGQFVEVRVDGLNSAAATNAAFAILPTGFRGHSYIGARFAVVTSTNQGRRTSVVDNTLYVGYTGTEDMSPSFTYSTTDAWPTTLPGTAVGSVPNA